MGRPGSASRSSYDEEKIAQHNPIDPIMAHKISKWDKFVLLLKQKLSMNSEKEKKDALRLLIQLFKKDLSISDNLIQSDILITLCVDTNAHKSALAKKTFYCLKLLMCSEKFLTLSYASHPLEFFVRLLATFLKEKRKQTTLKSILEHMSFTLQRLFTMPQLFAEIVGGKNATRIVKEIDKLFKTSPAFDMETLLLAGSVFTCILKATVMGDKQEPSWIENLVDVLKTVHKKLDSFLIWKPDLSSQYEQQDEKNSARVVALLARMGLSAVKLHPTLEHAAAAGECKPSDVLTDVLQIIETCTPFVANVSVNILYSDMYYYYFGCLRALCQDSTIRQECTNLSHKLATSGVLTLIPLVTITCDRTVRTISLKCMAEILALLSQDTFSLADYPDGFASLRSRLLNGIRFLDNDIHKWFDIPNHSHGSTSHQHTVIIFTYFFKLTPKDSEDGRSSKLFSLLVFYLHQMHANLRYQKIPSAITKALWLIFAISSLEEDREKNKADRATHTMLALLEAQDLHNVYTAHPALLNWSFACSKIPSSLRARMLLIWLEESNLVKNEVLVQLLIKYRNAGCCLLENVQSFQADIAANAIKVLQQAVSRQQKEGGTQLLQMLRRNMPALIARVSLKRCKLSLSSVGELLNLVDSDVPLHATMNGALVTVSHLIEVLTDEAVDAPLSFYSSIVQQLFQLLRMSLADKDKRVLAFYLNHKKFLETLEKAIYTADPTLVTNTYNILSYMLHFQHKNMITLKESVVIIDTQFLIKYLESKEEHVVMSAMRLISTLFDVPAVNLGFPVLTFSAMNDTDAVHFLQDTSLALHHVCLTNHSLNPSLSAFGFVCLGLMIRYASVYGDTMQKHIASEPWILWFIKHYLSAATHWCTTEFLNFICEWISHVQRPIVATTHPSVSFRRRKKSKVTRSDNEFMDTTVTALASAFIALGNFSEKEKQLQVLAGILKADAAVPENIMKQVVNITQLNSANEGCAYQF